MSWGNVPKGWVVDILGNLVDISIGKCATKLHKR